MKSFSKLIYPYIVWMTLLIVLPMLMILFYSVTDSGNEVLQFKFTLDHFARFFSDTLFPSVMIRSLRLSIVVTGICLLLGYPMAYYMSRLKPNSQMIILLLVTLPMWINMLVRTYAWRGLLMETSLSSEVKVYIGMVYNFIPFMILQIYTSLSKMDQSLLQASADLGANKIQTFIKVIFPLSLPGVISGITLVFLPAVSSFFIPKLLGGGDFVLIGNLIENYFVTTGDWNFGSAISLIMAFIIIISMYITKKLDKDVKEPN